MDFVSRQHRAAVELAEQGFAVFPCIAGGKKPAVKGGVHEATTDREKLDAWWTENPDYNIGCSPDASGCFVVDVDPKNNGEANLLNLELEHGPLPRDFTVATPSGGQHIWLKGHAPSTASKLAPGIDTRGGGTGYVLMPGSIVGGKRYLQLTSGLPADPPSWVAARVHAAKKALVAADTELDTALNVEQAIGYLSRRKGAVEGEGGDAWTYQTFAYLHDMALSMEKALELVEEHWNPKCEPPWDHDELSIKAENAYAYAQNEAGAHALVPEGALWGNLSTVSDPGESARRLSRFPVWSVSDITALPEPTWEVDGWLPDEGIGLIYGPWGSYKSFAALELALTRATGIAFYGQPARQARRVVYAAGEGARSMAKKRLPAWCKARQLPAPENFFIVPAVPWASEPDDLQAFVDAVQARAGRPDIVFLDTASLVLAGLDKNSTKDAMRLIQLAHTLVRIWKCYVVIVDHAGKEREKGVIGSIAIPAACDTVWRCDAHKETMILTLTCEKVKDGEEPKPLTLRGARVADSLVFDPISIDQARELTRSAHDVDGHKVGTALKALGATTPEKAVSGAILAAQIIAGMDTAPSSFEELIALEREVARQLRGFARGRGAAYVIGKDRWAYIVDAPPEIS